MPQPVAVSAIDTTNIESGYFLHMPDVLPDIVRRYGDQGAEEFMLIRAMGQRKPVARMNYQHSEERRYHATITSLTTVPSGGVGNSVFVTLDPIDLDPNGNFYPRLWDEVTFPNGVNAQIININTSIPSAPVLTIKPKSSVDAIPLITAGDEISITSDSNSEGSGQPASAISFFDTYTNYTQIVKETFTYTGSAETEQSWYRMDGIENAPYMHRGQPQMDYRFALKVSGALITGQAYTNTQIDPTTGNPIQSTNGWLPTLRERGNVSITVPGTFTPADLDEKDRIFDREGTKGFVMSWQGNQYNQMVNNSLVSYFKDTNIQMVREAVQTEMFGEAKGLMGTMNFKAIQKNQRAYAFKTFQYFTNPKVLGAPGYDYVNQAIWFPTGKGYDVKNKVSENYFGYRYKEFGSVNRDVKFFTTGSLGKIATTDLDLQNLYMRGDFGAQIFMANQQIYDTTN